MAGVHRPLLHGAQGRGVQADDGVRWGNIPTHPFLVAATGQVAPAGKDAIREIVLDYLADAVGGSGQGAENRRATT